MGAIVFVEVMDRKEQVKQRIPVNQLPVSIGRAYSNGIIIDDPFIYPVHARIEYNNEGEIVIVDVESKNRIKNSGKAKKIFKVSDQKGLTVTLGNTTIRVRSPEFIPEATKTRYSATLKLQDTIDNKPYFFLLLLLPLFYLFLSTYLSSSRNFVDSGLQIFLASCLYVCIWCAGWALLNRILSERLNFLFHLLLTCSVGLLFGVFYTSISYLSFFLRMDTFFEILFNVIVALLASVLLFGHLSIIGNIRLRTRLLFNVGSVILVGLFYLIFFFRSQRDFSPNISFNYSLIPVQEEFIPSISLEDFFNETKNLISKLKEE